MLRRNFLISLGALPLLLKNVSSPQTEKTGKTTILVGLGNAGEVLVKEFFRLGYQGKFRIIKTTNWDTKKMDDTLDKLLNEERFILNPHPKFSRLAKIKNAHFVFLTGLGGTRSTYLTAYAHQEMEREAASFQMFLTTPLEFEGLTRCKRANIFREATQWDTRIKFLSLEEELKNPTWTIKETFEMHVPERLYRLYLKNKV